MPARSGLDRKIVDAALEMADEIGWGALRLRQVADRLEIPLARLRVFYRDKDAVADAWLARADAAMLAAPPAGFADLPPPERLHRMMMVWLDALAPHRRVTGEILAEKMWPFHPHHNLALVFWVSRTVQWIREAALLDKTGRRRQVEEIGLTALFVATVRFWLRDESEGQTQTREWLARRLRDADRVMGLIWPVRHGEAEA
ncbi:MAG: TetR/AcrR family transcriptional regulator [Alphaproteobacteria bacterium]|nr:TetR/AcrR family transcriptional regulator [Alphaproteobacteria bacterium]